MPRIFVSINDAVGQKKFARLHNLFSNPMPVLQGPIRVLVLDAIRQQFETEGQYGGTAWQDLAESTVRERELLGFPPEHPILRRTDRLFDALQGKMTGGVGSKIDVRRNTFTLRTVGIPDAAAHQYGSEHSNLPARQLIPEPMPVSFMRQLRSIVSGYAIRASFETRR